MPAIIFSRISAFGAVYDIFAVSEPPSSPESFYDLRDEKCESVFLLPSLSADASVVSYKNHLPSPSAAFVGAVFLTRVRGLPLDDIDVESQGENFKMFLGQKTNNLHIFLPKCKLLCAKKEINIDKIQILVSDVDVKGVRISVTKCSDSSTFDTSVLSRMILCSDGFAHDGAVAYSLSEGCAVAKWNFVNPTADSILYAALAVATAEGVGTLLDSLTVKISCSEILVESAGSHLSVSDRKMKHLTLAAPDIL